MCDFIPIQLFVWHHMPKRKHKFKFVSRFVEVNHLAEGTNTILMEVAFLVNTMMKKETRFTTNAFLKILVSQKHLL